MKNIFVFNVFIFNMVFAGLIAKAQPCYIKYNYDAAGNRISRIYSCSTSPGPVLRKAPAIGTGADTTIANICTLHPNPSSGHFIAELKYPVQDADISITDIKGAVIVRRKMSGTETDFDISQYPPGVYVMHLKSKDYEFEAKVVKE